MPYRIIVADKDPLSLSTVSRVFENGDFLFSGVATVGDLKKAIKTFSPDLIILNSILADTHSWHSVHKIVSGIKASRDFSHVPILLMSGDPGTPGTDELKEVGADEYLNKPIGESEVRKAVETALHISRVNSVESYDEDITLDFEDCFSDAEEASARSHVQCEQDSKSKAHVVNDAQEPAASLVQGAEYPEVSFTTDDREGPYELTKEDAGLEQFQDASSWLDNFGQPASLQPLTDEANNTEQPQPFGTGFVSNSRDADVTGDGEIPNKLPQDIIHQNDLEPDPTPDLDSPMLPPFAEHGPSESTVDRGWAAPQYGDVLKQANPSIADALPSRQEIFQFLERHIASIMPSNEELAAIFQTAIERRILREFGALDSSVNRDVIAESVLGEPRPIESFPEEGYGLEETAFSLGTPDEPPFRDKRSPDSAHASVLELCLNNVIPGRNEIMAIVSGRIEEALVDAVEKVIREQIEKITSDLPS